MTDSTMSVVYFYQITAASTNPQMLGRRRRPMSDDWYASVWSGVVVARWSWSTKLPYVEPG